MLKPTSKIPSVDFFLSHPTQYFTPLLRALAKHTDLTVYYFSDSSIKGAMDKGFGKEVKWDLPLLDGYQYRFLKNYSGRETVDNNFLDLVNPGLVSALRQSPARVVIVHGWAYCSCLLTFFTCKLLGKKLWLRAENPLNQQIRKTGWKQKLKKLVLGKILFKHFTDKMLYIGSENKKFFRYYHVPEGKLVFTPYAVDNKYFQSYVPSTQEDKLSLRAKLNFPIETRIILFSGKYTQQKRPMDLLKAFAALKDTDSLLVMMGEGHLRSEMEHFIREHKLQVILTGFVNQSVVPLYYAAADIFVMCSGLGETWGLSINEAMNLHLPVIVSSTCGSATDLVQEGINGYTYEEGNIEQLKECLSKLLNDDVFRQAAGKSSAEIIQKFSIDVIVENMLSALEEEDGK